MREDSTMLGMMFQCMSSTIWRRSSSKLRTRYYSDDSDDSDDDDSDDDEEVPTNDPVADDDSDDDEEVPTDDPVAGGEFQDGSLEHPVDLTVEDEDVTKSGFVLKFLGTEIFRIQ